MRRDRIVFHWRDAGAQDGSRWGWTLALYAIVHPNEDEILYLGKADGTSVRNRWVAVDEQGRVWRRIEDEFRIFEHRMYGGVEIDMLSVGDADCILVSFWNGFSAYRVLVDGGNKGDAARVRRFLAGLEVSRIDEALATHLHDDHSGGFIELLADPSLTCFESKHIGFLNLNLSRVLDENDAFVVRNEFRQDIGKRCLPTRSCPTEEMFLRWQHT